MPTALTISRADGAPGKVYHPLSLTTLPPLEPLRGTQVHLRMLSAALNHRDLFIRQSLYPKTAFGVPLLADGVALVLSTGPDAASWRGKRVVINPGTGWQADPLGPEDPAGYRILGGTSLNPLGTAVDELVVDAGELEVAPEHLSEAEAAALPLTGLTAWRATMVKAAPAMREGGNVLVTGIGGGVAIMALLFAVGAGARVWVTSGSQEKIERAKELGARGGVSYKDKGWEKELLKQVSGEGGGLFDAVVDGAGGDIVEKAVRLLRPGGIVSQYGMTVSPKMSWNMSAVLKNIELKGSTMGSRAEFAQMLAFVNEKGLKPVVSRVVKGLRNLEGIDGLFEEMKAGKQFGKLVVEISSPGGSSKL